jgi:hypothetical protein
MIPKPAILICVPLGALAAWAIGTSTMRINALHLEIASLEETGKAEGASFVETLQGQHVEKQLQTFDRRRALAHALGDAQRMRFLGIFGLAAATFIAVALSVLSKISSEVSEDRRMFLENAAPDPNRRP